MLYLISSALIWVITVVASNCNTPLDPDYTQDVVLVLDSSGSVNQADWHRLLEFAAQTVETHELDSRFALVVYGSSTEKIFSFEKYGYDKAAIAKAIRSGVYRIGGHTVTGSALWEASEVILALSKERTGKIVLFTDGYDHYHHSSKTLCAWKEDNIVSPDSLLTIVGWGPNFKIENHSCLVNSPDEEIIKLDTTVEIFLSDAVKEVFDCPRKRHIVRTVRVAPDIKRQCRLLKSGPTSCIRFQHHETLSDDYAEACLCAQHKKKNVASFHRTDAKACNDDPDGWMGERIRTAIVNKMFVKCSSWCLWDAWEPDQYAWKWSRNGRCWSEQKVGSMCDKIRRAEKSEYTRISHRANNFCRQLPMVNVVWVVGKPKETCNDACGNEDMKCDQARTESIHNDNTIFNAKRAFRAAGIECIKISKGSGVLAMPAYDQSNGLCILRHPKKPSECGQKAQWAIRRLCACSGAPPLRPF